MIIIDSALDKLEDQGKPIRVGMIGAGYMGRGVALQILRYTKGMRLVAISNRTLPAAEKAYRMAGIEDIQEVASKVQLEQMIADGQPAITSDATLLCEAEGIDVIVEVTGTIEHASRLVIAAINHGKHVVAMNAELDATLGPILNVYAKREGVVYTNADGDQPGVIMNLYRWVKSIGCQPLLAGNMKGLQDPYRTPETQKAYAAQFKQKPKMVTSFADGSKISFEMAVVANATGLRAGKRGMYGPRCSHVNEAANLFPMDKLLNGGLVDYVLGAEPPGGVFVLGFNDDPIEQQYLNYYKMGSGPLYVFYTPYHLCHFEVPISIARAALFEDAIVKPLGGTVCDVITVAKCDLRAGDVLDGIGGFTSYGMLDNSDVCQRDNLLPMGLNEGCRLKKDVKKDQPISFHDVELPKGRFCDQLWADQNDFFRRDHAS
jgi:predicted homoserine dehydrogenase-like protein